MLSSSTPHGYQKDTEDALEGRRRNHNEEDEEEKTPEYRVSDKGKVFCIFFISHLHIVHLSKLFLVVPFLMSNCTFKFNNITPDYALIELTHLLIKVLEHHLAIGVFGSRLKF